jgi:hypothetical protein
MPVSTRNCVISTDTSRTRVWQFFLVLGFLAATVAVWREPTYTRPEQLVVLSLACVAAALVAVAVHRTLLPLVSPERIIGDARRNQRALVALEREKRLVLRSIKELEFDRAMGKVAEVDFDEMVGRLRDRAVGLMQRIEQGQQGLRDRVERDLASLPAADRPKQGHAGSPGRPASAAAASRVCGTCGTTNDLDARFCKQCGGAV